jgi:hypothetical protein
MNGTLRKEYVENTDAVRTMIHSRRKFREEGKAAVDEAAAEGMYVCMYLRRMSSSALTCISYTAYEYPILIP